MRNYVIINGVNSLTIQGLAIKTLPPITKPIQRNIREEIDGRDGDIVTTLGYGAYDKTIEIGLFGTFDIDEVIAFFNQKGTITFSNEADKVYYFQALEQVDYVELLKFRTANVVLHCQPFKYPTEEEPLVAQYQYVTNTGSNMSLDNTANALFRKLDLKGNTSQDGTPTPSSPIPINVVSGDNEINICGKNLLPTGTPFNGGANQWYDLQGNIMGTLDQIQASSNYIILQPNTTYKFFAHEYNNIATMQLIYIDSSDAIKTYVNSTVLTGVATFTTTDYVKVYVRVKATASVENTYFIGQLEKGNQATTYEPYIRNSYPIYLGVENLFDKNNANIINAGISNKLISSSDANRILYIRVMPNTTYTIQRRNDGNTNRFRAGSCSVVPANGVSLPNAIESDNATSITITTGASDTYLAVMFYRTAETQVTYQEVLDSIVIEYGSKANHTSTQLIELCKIGNYQDYIYKDNGSWYLHKEIGKVVLDGSESWSLYGTGTSNYFYQTGNIISNKQADTTESVRSQMKCNRYTYNTIGTTNTSQGIWVSTNYFRVRYGTEDTIANYKTWLSSNNVIAYYVLATPTNTEITDTNLIEQLEATKQANSYDGQTNISQTNNDMPFILDLSALKENSDHLVIDNIGNIYSKPTLDLEGTGIVDIYLNDTQMLQVDLSEKNEIVIDTEKMEAYNPADNTLANRQVVGDYSKFKLDSGENDLRFSGDLTKATITRYERWL